MEFRLSDNYKLELERDIKIKELDSDTAIAVKKIELDIQREKNKQIAMENGYDLTYFITDISKSNNKPNNKSNNKRNVIEL